MTAYGTIEGAVEAVKLGAFDYIKKPVDLEELKLLADRARETSLMKQELSYYRRREAARELPLAGVLGKSPAMRAVMEQARQIAALDETPPVLITGETGTGKGLVARTIHARRRAVRRSRSSRSTAPPCPPTSWRRSSSDTSAARSPTRRSRKIGLFEAAEGGFLFLDEVGDIELVAAGQAAAGDRGADRAAGRRHSRPADRRPHPGRHQPRPRARGAAGTGSAATSISAWP